ncbi:MAG: hypothetical protein JW967_08445 [Dehalococcoidales bacterium]|nr:hypothetical protein [Dehalococcoidales bacterium]
MRTLSSTLLAAQKQESRHPFVEIKATNRQMGIVRLDWTRLYTGTEPEGPHAVTMPGDGSLIRTRVTGASDGQKLYRQRVTNPEPNSNFSQWNYTGSYSVLAVALCSLGAEVSLLWVDTDYKLQRQKSTDYGFSWSSPELLDYVTSTATYGLAAAYKPNGEIAVFFTDQNTLFVKQYTGGVWQAKTSWDKTTGDLSGVAVVYESDWNLLLTGRDADNNPRLWSLIYGDGGDVTTGDWSALKEIVAAPAAEDFEFVYPFMDKPDVFRSFYVEKFTGAEAYQRPHWTYVIPESAFLDSLWHEPVPFNYSGEYGLAITHSASHAWLTSPSGVWRASLAIETIDLTNDVLGVKKELRANSGKLTVVLDNSNGKYASPGNGTLILLQHGCQLDFNPGFRTTAGNEASPGLSFTLESYEHTSSGGKACLILRSNDGWAALCDWKARYQFRWNKPAAETSIFQIIESLLARVGLRLEVKSASSVITGFYPDFTIHPGNSGEMDIQQLLNFVPDVIFIEGNRAYLVNPQSTDAAGYSYGTDHVVLAGEFNKGALTLNRVQIEGRYATTGVPILADTFNWDEINRNGERWQLIADPNIGTVAQAQARGSAYLKDAEIHADGGFLRIPVNCGQQMYDVVTITDTAAGLSAAKRRVVGISLLYSPEHARYEQRFHLGAV